MEGRGDAFVRRFVVPYPGPKGCAACRDPRNSDVREPLNSVRDLIRGVDGFRVWRDVAVHSCAASLYHTRVPKDAPRVGTPRTVMCGPETFYEKPCRTRVGNNTPPHVPEVFCDGAGPNRTNQTGRPACTTASCDPCAGTTETGVTTRFGSARRPLATVHGRIRPLLSGGDVGPRSTSQPIKLHRGGLRVYNCELRPMCGNNRDGRHHALWLCPPTARDRAPESLFCAVVRSALLQANPPTS